MKESAHVGTWDDPAALSTRRALVDLLSVFGVSAAGARGATQRLAQRGFLIGTRTGRHTEYAVAPMTRDIIDSHVQVLFLSHRPPAWDGSWTLLAYSVPEDAAAVRRTLRDRLRHLRFGALYDGLWLRPGDAGEQVVSELAALPEALHPSHSTVFTQARLPSGVGHDAVVEALQVRLDTGRWANVATPASLNQRADRIAAESGLDRGAGSFAGYRADAMTRSERAPR